MKTIPERYWAACYRVQTAIAFLMTRPLYRGHEPKHLRVGIDLLRAEQAGLRKLLLDKGLIRDTEYDAAMLAAVEEEAERMQREVQSHFPPGTDVRTH